MYASIFINSVASFLDYNHRSKSDYYLKTIFIEISTIFESSRIFTFEENHIFLVVERFQSPKQYSRVEPLHSKKLTGHKMSKRGFGGSTHRSKHHPG